jgi:CBS domain-containing protein
MTEKELITRNTPVSVINEILKLEPVIVQLQQPLIELVQALVEHPNVDVACVVNEQERLVGLLTLQSLADDLFMMIVPEEFLSETHDKEGVLRYAKLTATQTAKDAMIEPVWVRENETLKDAFRKMHDNQLSGIPLINDRYEITGYINLLELLAIYARSQNTSES